MTDPTVFGFLGLLGFLGVLAINVNLVWRHAPRLAEVLGFAEERGQIVHVIPEGEPNVVALRPRPALRPANIAPVRLAA